MKYIKTIKKAINHQEIVDDGFKLHRILKGFFKINGVEIVTPVLEYRKDRYGSGYGYWKRWYNKFGRI